MPILEAEGLVKTYGRRRVVDGVGFNVDYAEIVGLLGPNGAGKTTSFRMTCGLVEPDKGLVTLSGVDVTNWPMYRRAKEGMGYLAQEASVFRKLSVEQNLLGVMELLGFDRTKRRNRCDELLEQFKITHIRKSTAGSLSGGERRRLEIARCLISDPAIILLDEPFTGIDPVTIESIQGIIRELKTRGISILITDHQWRETLDIVDRSYIIVKGAVLTHGPKEVVLAHPLARELYFGTSAEMGESSARPAAKKPAPMTDLSSPAAEPPRPAPRPTKPTSRRSIHEEETLGTEP